MTATKSTTTRSPDAPKLKMPTKADFEKMGATDALAEKAGSLKQQRFRDDATSWQAKTYLKALALGRSAAAVSDAPDAKVAAPDGSGSTDA